MWCDNLPRNRGRLPLSLYLYLYTFIGIGKVIFYKVPLSAFHAISPDAPSTTVGGQGAIS